MAYTFVMNPFLTAASENGLSSPSCAPPPGWSSSPLLRPAAPPLPSPSSVSPSVGAGCWLPILHQCCRLPGLALCCCFAVLQYCSGAWPCPAAGAAHCTGGAADAVHGVGWAGLGTQQARELFGAVLKRWQQPNSSTFIKTTFDTLREVEMRCSRISCEWIIDMKFDI